MRECLGRGYAGEHELTAVRDKGLSERASLHDNLIVHGDNLAALKALLPTYHGKVKCIVIDPPYNTGNEGWAYRETVQRGSRLPGRVRM